VFPLEGHDPKTGEVSSGYRESGYMPEAVINFLALLGWNPGDDTEIMSLDELVKRFRLENCSRSGAKFDYVKAQWFNHEYILRTPSAQLAPAFDKILRDNGIEAAPERVEQVVEMMKGRVNFIRELWPMCRFFFVAPEEYDAKTVKKRWKPDSAERMKELGEVLAALPDFSIETQEKTVLAWIESKGYGNGNILNAFRLAIVGEGIGPHVFDISAFLGREETLRRLDRAIRVLG
jgi:glutamyl-tRNA synthetase